ncbi:hypothetical protein Leryth_026969 [Lithospermum erythrorhizon]|nr:hypothetical protein Leryth_026969 [Lithospermum erythrorhizon]
MLKQNDVNNSNAYEVMQCLSSQNSSSTASISSCADLNNTKKYSFISVEPSTQLQEMTIVNSQIGFVGAEIDNSVPIIDDLQLGYDDIPLNGSQRRKRKTMSCREYYVYKLQDRPNDKSYILRFGRLF